jgi:hypothetical protein
VSLEERLRPKKIPLPQFGGIEVRETELAPEVLGRPAKVWTIYIKNVGGRKTACLDLLDTQDAESLAESFEMIAGYMREREGRG